MSAPISTIIHPTMAGAAASMTHDPDAMEDPDQQQNEPQGPSSFLFADLQPDQKAERMKWLADRATLEIKTCRSEMGLSYGNPFADSGSWAWDRQIARMQYKGNFEWRKSTGGIFTENNWTKGVSRLIVRQMKAKVCSDILGAEPYFAAMPENSEKPELAKQVEKKLQDAIHLSNITEQLETAVQVALNEGERCIKITYEIDKTTFSGPATVAVGKDGQPIKTPKGDYIFEHDEFITSDSAPNEQPVARLKKELGYIDTSLALSTDQATGQPAWKSMLQYVPFPRLPQTLTNYEGLKAGAISCEDFLWHIKAPSLDDGKFMCHVYDEPMETLKLRFGYEPNIETQASPMAYAGTASKESGEMDIQDSERELCNIHECYMRCDADQDGEEEWIFMIFDFKAQTPLYAEYLGNMKMKRPPFYLIRGVEPEPGRAYGVGVDKMFAQKNIFIDVQLNRVALKSSKEGSVTVVHRDAFEETKAGLEFVVGGKQVYHVPAGTVYGKDKPGAYRINLNEVDEFGLKLMEQCQADGMLEFGILSASADGSGGSVLNPSGDATATETRTVERSGNLLHRGTENMIARDIEGLLGGAVEILLNNMDLQELSFDPESQQLSQLNRDEILSLDKDVRLLLTKVRSEESLAVNARVVELIERYNSYSLKMQHEVRPFYVEQLKSLEVADADERLADPSDADIAGEAAMQHPDVKMTEMLDFKELTAYPEAQVRLLVKRGLLTEQEGQAHIAAAVAQRTATLNHTVSQTQSPQNGPTGNGIPPTASAGTQAAGAEGQG